MRRYAGKTCALSCLEHVLEKELGTIPYRLHEIVHLLSLPSGGMLHAAMAIVLSKYCPPSREVAVYILKDKGVCPAILLPDLKEAEKQCAEALMNSDNNADSLKWIMDHLYFIREVLLGKITLHTSSNEIDAAQFLLDIIKTSGAAIVDFDISALRQGWMEGEESWHASVAVGLDGKGGLSILDPLDASYGGGCKPRMESLFEFLPCCSTIMGYKPC
jgi:hypothetical protein